MASGDAGDISTSIHQAVLQAAGAGGESSGSFSTKNKQPVAKKTSLVSDNIVNLVNAPTTSKKQTGRPSSSSTTSPSQPQQIDKQSLIIKINRYLIDDIIAEILERSGFDMRPVDFAVSIEVLMSKYDQIRNILGAKSAKENIVNGFLFVNSGVAKALKVLKIDNCLEEVSSNPEFLQEIQPELNEIAIEYGSLLGSGDPKWRLLMKYGAFVHKCCKKTVTTKNDDNDEEEEPDD